MVSIHSQNGQHFLGLRPARRGGYEIVYDATANGRRLILKLEPTSIDPVLMGQQLQRALESSNVLETLCSELRSSSVGFKIDADQSVQWQKSG